MKLGNFARILAVSLALSGYSAWVAHIRVPNAESTIRATRSEVAGIPLVRLAEAEALWRQSSTLFVDVRSRTDYEFGHIAGAIHLPGEEFENRYPELKPRLEHAQAIVVYCKSEDCGKSLWTAIRLHQANLTQTKIYPEGWNEWYLRGLPIAGLGR